MVTAIRVLLAEDHTIVRKGLRSLLEDSEDIKVIAEASDGREAVSLCNSLMPDVVVMDISMPLLNGLEATRQIKETRPETGVVMLTIHEDEEYIFQSLRSGAEGYLIKKAAPEQLVAAIKAANLGDTFLSPSISKRIVDQYLRSAEEDFEQSSLDRLSNREREVLQLIAEGFSVREIAGLLYISDKTVRTHLSNLKNKLNLENTAEIILYALRKGVIRLDDKP
jgi:RNA polymerase sigma factor (sigma-70 family)